MLWEPHSTVQTLITSILEFNILLSRRSYFDQPNLENCNTSVNKDKVGEGLCVSRQITIKDVHLAHRQMWVHPESTEKKRMTCIINLLSKDNVGSTDQESKCRLRILMTCKSDDYPRGW